MLEASGGAPTIWLCATAPPPYASRTIQQQATPKPRNIIFHPLVDANLRWLEPTISRRPAEQKGEKRLCPRRPIMAMIHDDHGRRGRRIIAAVPRLARRPGGFSGCAVHLRFRSLRARRLSCRTAASARLVARLDIDRQHAVIPAWLVAGDIHKRCHDADRRRAIRVLRRFRASRVDDLAGVRRSALGTLR